MAHELEFINGRASTFSVIETPWHREGVVLAAAPTYDEAIRLARLDYEVVSIPAHTPTGPNGELVPSRMVYCTMRTDTRQELGRVGPDYSPVQNADAFEVLKPLTESGVCKLETGGVLRDGADAWLQAKFDLDRFGPICREVFANEVVPYAMLSTNHSGRRGVLCGLTPVRTVCANTLGMAETSNASRWETVRHTGDAKVRLVDAAEKMFGGIIERYEVVAKQYRALRARILDAAEFEKHVLAVIAPDPRQAANWNPEAKMANVVIERYEKKIAVLNTLWTGGKGHQGDHSAWEAYNAAVEALDHNVDGLWPNRAGVYRTASLMGGAYGRMKDEVLDRVFALSA